MPAMAAVVLSVALFLACAAFPAASQTTAAATFFPTDNYLIDCGSSTNATIGTRTFVPDAPPAVTVLGAAGVPAAASPNAVSSFDNAALYQTARVFSGQAGYSFSILLHGRHFVRLYFFPFVYQSFNLSAAQFTVSTQDTVLLPSFQPPPSGQPVLAEFILNITRDTLILSFKPDSGAAGNGLSFVNAIEVISLPDNLIRDDAQLLNPVQQFQGLLTLPLRTMHRINMGGPKVMPDNDTLWRTWVNDGPYIVNPKVTRTVTYAGTINYAPGGATDLDAPDAVYSTATALSASNTTNALFNVTWRFAVDAGFSYFVRLHFCDIDSKALNQLYFNVFVGGWYAARDLDLSVLTNQKLAAAYFLDVVIPADGAAGGNLSLSIGPSTLSNVLPDAILNGLEVMKISPGSGDAFTVGEGGGNASLAVVLGTVLGVAAVLALLVCASVVICRRRKKIEKQQSKSWMPFSINGLTVLSTGSRTSNGTTLTSGLNGSFGYRFPFAVLQEATNNFDEGWVIGVGGFGKVYRGTLRGDTKVAVKRGNPKSQQGLNEFRTEIELLSRLRHRHLVSLIGYCDERNEMILVYEYMENGTLKSHLYGGERPALSWKQRLEICIGAARGLHYLHTGSAKAIIHRDVKSANILLDESLMAKVSDFGLSKTGPELDQTHVSTAVKGSFGYLDPEYFRRQQLTEKSDVYSFGVVLLEVLCARPVIDPTLPREMVNLAEWGMRWQKRGELAQIVDQRISGTIRPDSLRKFGETVEKCLADYGVERPAMGDVLWNLEYVLQLQEAEFGMSAEVNSMNRIVGFSSRVELSDQESPAPLLDSVTVTVTDAGGEETSGASGEHDLSDVSMSRVFSQLIKAEGR